VKVTAFIFQLSTPYFTRVQLRRHLFYIGPARASTFSARLGMTPSRRITPGLLIAGLRIILRSAAINQITSSPATINYYRVTLDFVVDGIIFVFGCPEQANCCL
jgi:hypothetical protein